MRACLCCHDENSRTFAAREMMFGFREEFRYEECLGCGCLELLDVPTDLGRYYPPGYYSFRAPDIRLQFPDSGWRRWVQLRRNAGQILGRSPIGVLLACLRPRPDFSDLASYFRHARGVTFGSPILDVGCGSGALLYRMAAAGFRNLWGVDPYVEQTIDVDGRLKILAGDTTLLHNASFDFIMLHHSLEHMIDQRGALLEIKRLLTPDGTCLIRIPLAGSDPWARYGPDWVELDPPRHICLHTRRSLTRLAQDVGLDVVRIEYDSDAFAYWASELYRQNVPLVDPKSHADRMPHDYFNDEQMRRFQSLATDANSAGCGGRAAFYIRHRKVTS